MFPFIGLIASSGLAILFILLGLPLFFKKVKRNYFYGYRVGHYAMIDDEIWYAVNQQGGRHLIVMGSLLAGNSFFAWLFLEHTQVQGIILNMDAIILIVGFIYSIIKGRNLNERLAIEKGLKSSFRPKNN